MRSRHAHQSSWAQAILDARQTDPVADRPREQFPAPLTAADLRAIHRDHKEAVVRALLWEIARLRSKLRRAEHLRMCVLGDDLLSRKALPHLLHALEREFRSEPCLQPDEPGRESTATEEELLSRGP